MVDSQDAKPRVAKTKSRRKPISTKVRFEVFKRDSFTCQYCGSKAPDVILEVDHIHPVKRGGTDDLLNLVTSCRSCNGGKGATPLDDRDMLQRQRAALEELEERRQQIEAMAKWRSELARIDDIALDAACNLICEIGWHEPNEHGRNVLRKLLTRHGAEKVLAAIQISFSSYLEWEDGKPSVDSWIQAFNKIGGVITVSEREARTPGYKRLFYIRGILRNNVSSSRNWMPILEQWVDLGVPIEEIEWAAKNSRSYSGFNRLLDQYLEAQD